MDYSNINNNSKELYFIAETAFHHEGDVKFLENLVKDLLDLNVNAIKFHLLLDIDDYIIKDHPAVEILRKISLSKDQWLNLFESLQNLNVELVLLCNDLESIRFVNEIQDKYKISAIELHSTGLNDLFLLEESLKFKKTVILGVGGSSFDEIKYAIEFLRQGGKSDILLMHGFQNYPTQYSDINFRRINLLATSFEVEIGYADHTDPKDENNGLISVLPIMNGVRVIEKHVTNRENEKRIDSQAAVSLNEMKRIITLAKSVHSTLGSDNYLFSDAELKYGDTGPMKKAIVARKLIEKGTIITKDHIAFKRTEKSSSILQKDISKILGSKALVEIKENDLLDFSNLEYTFKKNGFEQFFIKKEVL